MNPSSQYGFILAMTLFYLLIITLLMTSVLESGLIQLKVSGLFTASLIALQNAESALVTAETTIQSNEEQGTGNLPQATYTFARMPTTDCGVIYYQIHAIGVYAAAKKELKSRLAIPSHFDEHCLEPVLIRKRIVWQEVGG